MSKHMKTAEVAELLGTIVNDILKITNEEKELIEKGQYTRALVGHELLNSMFKISDFIDDQSDRFEEVYLAQITNLPTN